MNKRINTIIMAATALTMLIAIMAVTVAGLTQITDGVHIAVTEKTDETAGVIARTEAKESANLENGWGFSGQVATTQPDGYMAPLGESETTGPDKTLAYGAVLKIQTAMIGIVVIGIVAVLVLLWHSVKRQKE